MTKEVMLHLIWIAFTWEMQYCSGGYYWHHVIQIAVLHVTNSSTSGIPRAKGNVAPIFNCLDLGNAMVPMMIPLASHDNAASIM